MMDLYNNNKCWMFSKYKKMKMYFLLKYIKISNFILNNLILYIKK